MYYTASVEISSKSIIQLFPKIYITDTNRYNNTWSRVPRDHGCQLSPTSVMFNHEMEIFNFKWKRTYMNSVSNQIAASENTILTVTISKSLCLNLSNCCLCKEMVCNSHSHSKICCISVDNWLICSTGSYGGWLDQVMPARWLRR